MKRKKTALQTEIGARCFCQRCKVECQVAPGRKEEAQLMRKSAKAEGYCVNCAFTEWLANTYPVNQIIETSQSGPEMLRFPHIQMHIGRIFKAGKADANVNEINWDLVIQNWHLPLEVRETATNPHLPGDSMRRRLEEMGRESAAGGKRLVN